MRRDTGPVHLPSRFAAGILLLTCAACSQRAAWRVVPEPATASPHAERGVSQQAEPPAVHRPPEAPALATMAVANEASVNAAMASHLSGLQFPVPAVESQPLADSFNDPRDGGARVHAATDIMAPKGTPILAADDGHILRLSRNRLGGITVYATDLDEQFVYYYAHLDHYYAHLYAGKPITRGDTLGYVGSTGNATADAPHLHFQVMRMPADRKRYWDGDPINVYPYLRDLAAQAAGTTQQLTAP